MGDDKKAKEEPTADDAAKNPPEDVEGGSAQVQRDGTCKKCMEACKNFEWKKNKWVVLTALGIILILLLIMFYLMSRRGLIPGMAIGRDAEVGVGEEYQILGAKIHNELRAKHGSPPVKLTDELNELAVKCAYWYLDNWFPHECPYKKNYGENIFVPWPFLQDPIPGTTYGVNSMYKEIENYDFSRPGDESKGVNGHFTQIVWKGTKRIGIGYANNKKQWCMVYLYDPWGNDAGKYAENVMPPK